MTATRILVVIDDTFDSPDTDVPAWAERAILDAKEVHLLAPSLGSRLSVATDDDEPPLKATERLETVTAHLKSIGALPIGVISRDGPLQAIETYLLDHDIDRIVVGVTEEGHWREKGLLEKLEEQTDVEVHCLLIVKRDGG